MTERVRAALDAVPDGGTLSFAPGTYHFYADGSKKTRLFPSNNTAGEKAVVFPVICRRNLVIDGKGATFVMHGRVFPFAVSDSSGITIRNLTMNAYRPQIAEFVVTEKRDDGFLVRFSENSRSYRVTADGGMVFESDGVQTPTFDRRLSLHAVNHVQIHYLFSGDTSASMERLATTFVRVDAKDIGGGEVFFRYRPCTHEKCVRCPFGIDDPIAINLAENRDRMSFFFENCRDVSVENVTVNRGTGMGVVAQMCENVHVRALKVFPLPGDSCSLTADAMQMVNCAGSVLVEECEIANTLDDVLNVHGNYLSVEEVCGKSARIRAMHDQHRGVFPFRPGDKIEFSVPKTREILGTARVESLSRDPSDDYAAVLSTDVDLSRYPKGTLVENVTLCPDVTVRNNRFHDFPRVIVSGRGRIVLEDNRFERFVAGFYSSDSSGYWYESGRLSDVTIRRNVFSGCNAMGGSTCIGVFLAGWAPGDPAAPKINGRVTLQDNVFKDVRHPKTRVVMTGVREFSEH